MDVLDIERPAYNQESPIPLPISLTTLSLSLYPQPANKQDSPPIANPRFSNNLGEQLLANKLVWSISACLSAASKCSWRVRNACRVDCEGGCGVYSGGGGGKEVILVRIQPVWGLRVTLCMSRMM